MCLETEVCVVRPLLYYTLLTCLILYSNSASRDQSRFCNRVPKPERLRMSSFCHKDHFLLKQANYLATMAWIGDMPDQPKVKEEENKIISSGGLVNPFLIFRVLS